MKRIGALYRESIAKHIKEGIEKQNSVFLVSYSRISSMQMDTLRKTLKKIGARLYVSNNNIAKRTLKNLKFDNLAEKINGQTAFIWGEADSVEVSKALTKFAKELEGLKLNGGLLGGKVLEAGDIKRLSDLPSREVLLAMLLGSIQSPLHGLLNIFTGKTRELLYLLKQLSEQRGGK